MTQVQGPPPGTTIVEDAPTAAPSGRGRGGDKAPRVKMGAPRWFKEIGWRHLVGVIAVIWALFLVSYLVSASLNPLGTLASTELVPTRFSLDNYTRLIEGERGPFTRWFTNTLAVCGAVCARPRAPPFRVAPRSRRCLRPIPSTLHRTKPDRAWLTCRV